jgi:hypothetical protein
VNSDQELLLRAIDGDLSTAEESALSARLAAEPALARELVLLGRQEALLSDAVSAAAPAAPVAGPARTSFSRGGLLTMAASTLLFAGVLAAILWPSAPVTPVQDGKDVAALIDKLRSADIGERDAAAADLKKLPLEKLPLLEKALASDDAEVAGKVREAMAAVLATAFSRTLPAGELRAVADAKTLKQWQKDKVMPEGYEVFDYQQPTAPKPMQVLVRTKPGMSVKAGGAVLKEGKDANGPALTSAGGGSVVDIELSEESEKAFAEVSGGKAYLQVAVMMEGRLLHYGTISTRPNSTQRMLYAQNKELAQRVADLLNGKLVSTGFRAMPDRADAATPEAAAEVLKKAVEKIAVAIEDKKVVASVPVEVKSPDLVAAWKAMRAIGWKLEK